MQRVPLTPRPNWQSIVEAAGLTFHTPEPSDNPNSDRPYWDESAAYQFTPDEIDTLEAAGNELQTMCLAAAQHIIDNKRYAELDIPEAAIPAIEWAWNNQPPALYGRFDIAWAGAESGQPPKLLEYNADTPTSLLEAAVIQWSWLEDLRENSAGVLGPDPVSDPDQFNSIHDSLIARWKDIDAYLSKPVYFCALDNPEDQLTLAYLRDTAQQAGLETLQMYMEEIGWNDDQQLFLDPNEEPMFSIFKLYPWEAMVNEEFGIHTIDTYTNVRWIEPIWKMLLSNKGILPILWELYPNHDLLLPAYFEDAALVASTPLTTPGSNGWQEVVVNGNGNGASSPLQTSTAPAHGLTSYVRKPLFSREGANITLIRDGETIDSTDGPYTGRCIVQGLAPDFDFPDHLKPDAARFPILGLWMVDQDCCGMGIRESGTPITDNLSSFLPHFIA